MKTIPGFALARDWIVICAFDGTVTRDNMARVLFEHYADPVRPGPAAGGVRGKPDPRACLRRQVAALNVTEEALETLAGTAMIRRGFGEFVIACDQHDVTLKIVSDGLEPLITPVMAASRATHVPLYANRMRTSGGTWQLETPHRAQGCPRGVCKCRIAGRTPQRIILIGGGASSFCLAETADFVIAHGDLLERCRARFLPHTRFVDFHSAWLTIADLIFLRSAPRQSLAPDAHAVSNVS